MCFDIKADSLKFDELKRNRVLNQKYPTNGFFALNIII